jgi:hypothetical protein
MRFKTIYKRVAVLENKAGLTDFVHRVGYLLDAATQNAEDTVHGEAAMTEAEYEKVALASLEVLLAGSGDAEVQAWYRKQGFRW